jgi:hypothetical protein
MRAVSSGWGSGDPDDSTRAHLEGELTAAGFLVEDVIQVLEHRSVPELVDLLTIPEGGR